MFDCSSATHIKYNFWLKERESNKNNNKSQCNTLKLCKHV